jgi:antitoxin VapB
MNVGGVAAREVALQPVGNGSQDCLTFVPFVFYISPYILVVLTIKDCVDMVLHVRDEKTDELARELAGLRGLSLTEAVREALESAVALERARDSLWKRTADLREQVASFPATGEVVDKAFYDSLYDEGAIDEHGG